MARSARRVVSTIVAASFLSRVRARLRSDGGFGLVELLVAMMILNIGLIAILGAFVSGTTALRRSSRIATANTLADSQMELYRALKYTAIALDPLSVPFVAPYSTDPAYQSTQVTQTCSLGTYTSYPQCNASRTVTGPDGHSTYRVDTYIVRRTPTNGRELKLITVVVRDPNNLNGPVLARQASSFDASTGS
jgi:type II secretory pathway pseudopilin PulG